MALEGFDYNADVKDISWDSAAGSPRVVRLDEKVCRDLLEILWVESGIYNLIGTLNVATLVRVQEAANRAKSLYANRQATLTNLDPREQVVNFEISGIEPDESSQTGFAWTSRVSFRGGNESSLTL